MSAISASLRAQGRSTYRELLRSASIAFQGDARVLNGFRDKIRADFTTGRAITSEEEYTTSLKHGKDVAEFLRKNVVQGVSEEGSDLYSKLPICLPPQLACGWREGIELGDNDTIKNALRQKNSRRAQRLKEKQEQPLLDAATSAAHSQIPELSTGQSSLPPPPSKSWDKLSKKALIEARNKRVIPQLNEEDLEETFVRGSGPGGQAINKTRSNVNLVHKPTGIRVTCQDTRSLEQNRKIARSMLIERLDRLQNAGLSKLDVKVTLERRRKANKQKKANRKKKALAAVSSRGDGVDDD
ncbi:hypothetical protein DL93DRAFT_2052511 [Clavulina sp. PMI_390]|nr:hypothetical protein DL93DRAFT_2052511 [Clavulina sp. PMI_390]